MNTKNIKKQKREVKNLTISIRVNKKLSKWLKEKEYSPTGIFYEAVRDLGFKEE